MSRFLSLGVRTTPSVRDIGPCVAEVLNRRQQQRLEHDSHCGRLRVVAIVPRMATYFASSPPRYEVTEVDVLLEVD